MGRSVIGDCGGVLPACCHASLKFVTVSVAGRDGAKPHSEKVATYPATWAKAKSHQAFSHPSKFAPGSGILLGLLGLNQRY